jgi:transposase-like protein
MLSEVDYQEAVRRYTNRKVSGPERPRSHALILVHQGDSYREVGQILRVDEETTRRWVRQYLERGLTTSRTNELRSALLRGCVRLKQAALATGSRSKAKSWKCGCTMGPGTGCISFAAVESSS